MLAAPAALLAAVAAAAPAQAEEVWTTQAATARTEATMWAGAGDPPGGVCLVDTGVDENPDTLAVVERLAMDGGAGTDVSQGKHGTLMAMIAAGGHNGWGMVGAAPAVRIVSVRAWRPGESSFNFNDVRRAIKHCTDIAPAYALRVINLSLGSPSQPDSTTLALMEDAIDRARARGLSVVAATGNSPGPPDTPADYAPVLAVGAGSVEGAPCSWAASGAEVLAQGCPVDVGFPNTGAPAWSNGSSQAAAFTSGVLAQLRGLRPDLSVDAAEALLVASTRRTFGGRVLDAEAAFRAAGLAAELDAGRVAAPPRALRSPATSPPTTHPPLDSASAPPPHSGLAPTPVPILLAHPAPSGDPGSPKSPDPPSVAMRRRPWPRPRVRSIRLSRGFLVITLARRPVGSTVVARVVTRGRTKRGVTRWYRGSRIRVALRAVIRVELRHEGAGRPRSAVTNVVPK